MTFGQQCVVKLLEAQTVAQREGRQITHSDMARVIDAEYTTAAPFTLSETEYSKTIPPAPADVTAYSASIGYPMDGQAWCDHYATKGWLTGRSKMKDWQAAVRSWKVNRWGLGTIARLEGAAEPGARGAKDYTKF